jgi:hypothetical protein
MHSDCRLPPRHSPTLSRRSGPVNDPCETRQRSIDLPFPCTIFAPSVSAPSRRGARRSASHEAPAAPRCGSPSAAAFLGTQAEVDPPEAAALRSLWAFLIRPRRPQGPARTGSRHDVPPAGRTPGPRGTPRRFFIAPVSCSGATRGRGFPALVALRNRHSVRTTDPRRNTA